MDETPWMPTKTYAVPQIKINGNETFPMPNEKSILDYMGVPTKVKKPFSINALPIRAYVKIWNEFFRDENVDNAAVLKSDDTDVTYKMSTGEEDTMEKELQEAVTGGNTLPVNKFHDYFTSCLPYPQRGPEVTLPMTGNAQIVWPDSAENMADGLIFQAGPGNLNNTPVNSNMKLSTSKNNNKNGKALIS